MASNSFGEIFRITSFGESHGPVIGVVIDGCPADIPICVEDFVPELQRRRPGQSHITTPRKEDDSPEILSGVFAGKTTGAPIAIIVKNTQQKSGDYDRLKNVYRPGHADETYQNKYGYRDYRGGGRASGRETIARVISGVIARKILPTNTQIIGHTKQIGPIVANTCSPEDIEKNAVRSADLVAAKSMIEYIKQCQARHDSVGGMIEIRVINPPKNLGDPTFRKLKAVMANALMSIGAITSFSYGIGQKASELTGSQYVTNDDHFGGILGGISTGKELTFQCAVKPTSSIGKIASQGRHDPCIVPRIIPVAEAMVAIVLADLYLAQISLDTWQKNHLPHTL